MLLGFLHSQFLKLVGCCRFLAIGGSVGIVSLGIRGLLCLLVGFVRMFDVLVPWSDFVDFGFAYVPLVPFRCHSLCLLFLCSSRQCLGGYLGSLGCLLCFFFALFRFSVDSLGLCVCCCSFVCCLAVFGVSSGVIRAPSLVGRGRRASNGSQAWSHRGLKWDSSQRGVASGVSWHFIGV